jgi:hypothetical protein
MNKIAWFRAIGFAALEKRPARQEFAVRDPQLDCQVTPAWAGNPLKVPGSAFSCRLSQVNDLDSIQLFKARAFFSTARRANC